MSSTNISSMLRRIQSRKSIDAHVQVTNGDAVYYFNVFTKESSWEPPPNLFDWTVVIHDDGAMRFRNRVNGSTSQHVPITLTRVIKEDLRKLETPPTPASGVRPTGAGAGSGVGSGVRRAAAVTAVAAVPAVHVAVGDEVIAHHGSVMGGGGAEEAGAEPASGEGEVEDPADWASYLDEASGDDYWYNHKTGESRWEPPPIVEAALAAEPPALPSFGNGGGAGAPGQSAAAAAGDGSVRRQPASPPLAGMKAVAAGTESAGVSRHSTDGGFDGGGDSSGDGYGGGSGGGDDGRGDDYGGGGGGNGGGRGGGGHRGGYSGGGGGGGGGGSRSRTSPLAVIVDHTLGNLSDPLRATLAQKGSPAVSPAMVATSAEQRRWKEDERRRRERNTKSRVTSAELRDRVSLLSMSISACILKALTWQEKRSVNVTQLRHQHQLGGNAATAHTKVGASYLWRLAYDGVDQFSVPSLFDCKVYAPSIFSKIRKQSGISNALFKHSFSHEVSNAALGVGKSGMLFFATSDNKFVIKTLKKGELAFLFHTKFLQDYFYHLTQHPRSRLIRFYGVYTLTVKGTDYHIVVMNNVLYTKDHDVVHKYDLKGSTKDRSVSTEDFRRGAVGKDLNFGANKIYLGPALKHDFMSQLAADVWFLQRNNVMDYSLFIGLAHPRKAADGSDAVVVVDDANPSHYSNVCKLWPQREHLHNIPWAREVEWHYFCAIVDILQPFDIKKKAESVIFQSNEEEISAVPSDYYGQRILDFVEGHCT